MASTSSTVIPKAQKRGRIKQAGVVILEEYFQNVSTNPNATQGDALLQKIYAVVPGCESFRLNNLNAWFQRRRSKKYAEAGSSSSQTVPRINTNYTALFPSLTSLSIQHLRVLSQSQASPPPDVVATWAVLLNATKEDVSAWLDVQQQESATDHLPTPSESTSPEPRFASKEEPPQSPLISDYSISPFLEHPRPPNVQIPPPSHSTPSHESNGPRTALVQTLSTTPTTPLPGHPRSAAEFNALFQPYEEKMKMLFQIMNGPAPAPAV